ncbi:MAG: NADP-dependent isocitrate dehydrogenase, partial [Desulfobulbaceae bacterium]
DTRGSHFYLALYWAQCLAERTEDAGLQARFSKIAAAFAAAEEKIVTELAQAQGQPVDIGGYYHPDQEKLVRAMRPSPTFNAIIDTMYSGSAEADSKRLLPHVVRLLNALAESKM